MNRGIFIAFEGVDGAGKSTLVRAVAAVLAERGHIATMTAEPTGGAYGRGHARYGMASMPRLSWTADRGQHMATIVRPALDAGDVVLCDRHYWSTAAYQGRSGSEAGAILLEQRDVFGEPDLWVLVSTPLPICRIRLDARGEQSDHIEAVHRRYLATANLLDADVVRVVTCTDLHLLRTAAEYVANMIERKR